MSLLENRNPVYAYWLSMEIGLAGDIFNETRGLMDFRSPIAQLLNGQNVPLSDDLT
jgi:hypothetical protein